MTKYIYDKIMNSDNMNKYEVMDIAKMLVELSVTKGHVYMMWVLCMKYPGLLWNDDIVKSDIFKILLNVSPKTRNIISSYRPVLMYMFWDDRKKAVSLFNDSELSKFNTKYHNIITRNGVLSIADDTPTFFIDNNLFDSNGKLLLQNSDKINEKLSIPPFFYRGEESINDIINILDILNESI